MAYLNTKCKQSKVILDVDDMGCKRWCALFKAWLEQVPASSAGHVPEPTTYIHRPVSPDVFRLRDLRPRVGEESLPPTNVSPVPVWKPPLPSVTDLGINPIWQERTSTHRGVTSGLHKALNRLTKHHDSHRRHTKTIYNCVLLYYKLTLMLCDTV